MRETRLAKDISALVDGFVERGEETPRALGWPNRENQRTRFLQLLRLIDRGPEPFSVNDLGCGFADLYGCIRDEGLPMRGYRDYDVSERMLAVARKRVGPDAELVRFDAVTELADYSFACGIFNTNLIGSDAEWVAYIERTAANLFEHSAIGFAFNAMTTWVDYREDHVFYADPVEMFRFCKRELSPRVALLHDYPLWEWTILVRRPETSRS